MDPDSAEKVEESLKEFACIWITHDSRQADRVGTRHITLTRSQPSTPTESEYENNQQLTMPDQLQEPQKQRSRRLSPSAFRGGLPVDIT